MDKGIEQSSSPSTSLSSSGTKAGWPSTPKRPAGRTKFQETRHPVFRGVRRRGRAGRWVCEVRVPGSSGDRLWVGTFDTAEAAARAHDAAMLALCGPSATLNFTDSAWLLDVPRAPVSALPDVQRAANEAVADFQRRGAASHTATSGCASTAPVLTRNATPSRLAATEAVAPAAALTAKTPPTGTALDNDMLQGDLFGGMDADLYYASMAQGLLIEPPPTTVECLEDEECCGAEMELWS